MNQSTLKHGLKSMMQLQHAQGSPPKGETKPMRVGSGAQSLLELGPTEFHQHYSVMPELHLSPLNVDAKGNPSKSKNTTACKLLRSDWLREHGGYTVVSADEYEQILGIVGAVYADPIASVMARNAKHEVTLTWQMDGVACKARVDMLGSGWFADTKTTANVDSVAFGRVFSNFDYGFQLAFYEAGLSACGWQNPECRVLTVESMPPHDVAVVPIEHEQMEPYRSQVRRVLAEYRKALETDQWPGVARGKPYYELRISNWAMRDEDLLDWEGSD